MKTRKITAIIVSLAMALSFTACEEGEKDTKSDSKAPARGTAAPAETRESNPDVDNTPLENTLTKDDITLPGYNAEAAGNVGEVELEQGDVYAVMRVKDFGDITLKLLPECAPKAVQNFIDLSLGGYYDGKLFHRVMNEFMIQGGSPFGDGMSDNEYTTFGVEPHPNAVHKYGALSMANAGGQNAQQFFIVNAKNGANFLDGDYSVFGQVVDGYDVLDAISAIEVKNNELGEMSKPVQEVSMVNVAIYIYEDEAGGNADETDTADSDDSETADAADTEEDEV